VQGTQASKQGQFRTKNFEKMDTRKEASVETGMQKWDKEPRPETAATKQEQIQQDPREDPRTGVCEVSGQDVQRVT
jgi:hypothetical protein